MPGIAASTSDTCEFGSPPNAVAAPENSFAFELTWAWTSSPMTTSQSPVAPLMNFEVDVCTFMKVPWVTVGLRLRADRRLRQGDASPASDQCVILVSGAISHRVRPSATLMINSADCAAAGGLHRVHHRASRRPDPSG